MLLIRREKGLHTVVKTGVTVFSHLQARRSSHRRGAGSEKRGGQPQRVALGLGTRVPFSGLLFKTYHCEMGQPPFCAVIFHAWPSGRAGRSQAQRSPETAAGFHSGLWSIMSLRG